MDHVIDYIMDYMRYDLKNFEEEAISGKYDKLSDCPSYYAIKAYCDAMKPLYKYQYGEDYSDYPTPTKLLSLADINVKKNTYDIAIEEAMQVAEVPEPEFEIEM